MNSGVTNDFGICYSEARHKLHLERRLNMLENLKLNDWMKYMLVHPVDGMEKYHIVYRNIGVKANA